VLKGSVRREEGNKNRAHKTEETGAKTNNQNLEINTLIFNNSHILVCDNLRGAFLQESRIVATFIVRTRISERSIPGLSHQKYTVRFTRKMLTISLKALTNGGILTKALQPSVTSKAVYWPK